MIADFSSGTTEERNPEVCGMRALLCWKPKQNLLIQNPIPTKISFDNESESHFHKLEAERMFLPAESHHDQCSSIVLRPKWNDPHAN